MHIKKGDIFYADLTPVIGSEQGGVRPVLIIQNDMGNRFSPTVIAAAITSRSGKHQLPTHIKLEAVSYTHLDVYKRQPEGGVERYAYDYAGNITSTTDANGGTITYRYNSQGQVSEITDQEGNSEYFYYDEEGRQETHVDRNGNVERTLYNMDNQMVYQRAEDKKGRNPVVNQYVYYPDGSLKEEMCIRDRTNTARRHGRG